MIREHRNAHKFSLLPQSAQLLAQYFQLGRKAQDQHGGRLRDGANPYSFQ
jgi:hypothetical protein